MSRNFLSPLLVKCLLQVAEIEVMEATGLSDISIP